MKEAILLSCGKKTTKPKFRNLNDVYKNNDFKMCIIIYIRVFVCVCVCFNVIPNYKKVFKKCTRWLHYLLNHYYYYYYQIELTNEHKLDLFESSHTSLQLPKKTAQQRNVKCAPVPIQSLLVVPVKEVRLIPNGSNIGMNPQSFQQSPCPPFLHSDYNGLGQFFHPVIRCAVHHSPKLAVRGAVLRVLVLSSHSGGSARHAAAGRSRLRSRPSRCPLVDPHAISNARDCDSLLGRCPLDELLVEVALGGGRVKFLPQRDKSCFLSHQPSLINVVLLELEGVVAAHQAIEQIGDRKGEGEHE